MMKNGLPPPNYGAIEKNSSEEENEEIKAKEEEAQNYSTDTVLEYFTNYRNENEPLIRPESGNYLGICLYV